MKTVDEHALRGLHRLRHLRLYTNYLRSAPPLTHIGSSLETLDLSVNRICKIPSSYFANCTKLTFLDLSENCLNVVPHLLRISYTIQGIILNGNVITSAETLFENTLQFLNKLGIGTNLLSFWCFPPRSFWPNLESLNLQNIQLLFVTEPFNYDRIFITLEQHNLSCSSHLNWMRQCRTTKYHCNESRMMCGKHDETVLVDVSFWCPGGEGWLERNLPKILYRPSEYKLCERIIKFTKTKRLSFILGKHKWSCPHKNMACNH